MSLFQSILNTIPRPLLIKLSYPVRYFLTFWLKGKKFTDPIDGKSFRKMLPYGYEVQRKNVLSPSTLSLERHRLMWLYLKNETDFFTSKEKKKLLHIAPEQCFYSRFRHQKNLEYVTSDLESPLADVKADICDLPFDDNSFDIIFCNHVFEHVPNDKKAMQELFRVMKPGGFGIFQIPQDIERAETFEDDSVTDPKERAKVFGQYDHVRIYGMDYFDKLRSAGFEVNEIKYYEKIPSELVTKYALDKTEILPVCYKN